MRRSLPQAPGLAAVTSSTAAGLASCSVHAALAKPLATLTMIACVPPPSRNSITASILGFMLPGAKYVDPELSWKFESGPAGTEFVHGTALGAGNDGLFYGNAAFFFTQVKAMAIAVGYSFVVSYAIFKFIN